VSGAVWVDRPYLADRVVAAAGTYPSAGKAGGSDDEAGLLATPEACARVWFLSPSMATQKQLRAKPTNNSPLLLALSSSLSLARARGPSLSRDALQISKPLSKQIVVYAKTHPTFSSGVRAFGQIINRMTGKCLCVCCTHGGKPASRETALSGLSGPSHCPSPPLPSLSQCGRTVLRMGRAPTESRRNSVRCCSVLVQWTHTQAFR
jgi:hypothetical protein